ncbi:Uncharacterised protein [Mycobacteroides abscessus subsp. massiliense]|nr:Uncharacterised protein [Mycobacteroides abscessus subsp. massiliense]SLD71371.1 Uncharacterised protein [Mycobacteroides abscessus subsp. massiliense]
MPRTRKPMGGFGIRPRLDKPGNIGPVDLVELSIAARLTVKPQIGGVDLSAPASNRRSGMKPHATE